MARQSRSSPSTARRHGLWLEIGVIAAITVVAAALRLWRLGAVPPGLHVDEAYNLLDARAVLGGWRPAFLPANAGREALYTYLQAPLVALLGPTTQGARLASALIGTLTVPALWGFVRSLRMAGSRRVATLSAAVMAVSYWHLHFSRFGIRAVLLPLIVILTLWTWWLAVRSMPSSAVNADRGGVDPHASRPSLRPAIALGILLGAAVYAHPAGRALAAVPALHMLALRARHGHWAAARVLVVAGSVAVIVALPVIRYWSANPWAFAGHAGEVSVMADGPTAVAINAVKVAAMFNVAGDPAPWRNSVRRPWLGSLAWLTRDTAAGRELPSALRGRPAFDPLLGLLFLYGGLLTARAARRGQDWADLTAIALLVLVLPTVATDAAPNFSRAIGALPVACLLPALALDDVASRVVRRAGGGMAVLFVGVVLAVAAASTMADYAAWARDPRTPLAFDADKVNLGSAVAALAAEGRRPLLSSDTAAHPTVQVAAGAALSSFDARHGLVIPWSPEANALYVGLPNPADEAFLGFVKDQVRAMGGRPVLRRHRGSSDTSEVGAGQLGDAPPDPTTWLSLDVPATEDGRPWSATAHGTLGPGLAEFATFADLVSADMPENLLPGQRVTTTLLWRADGPSPGDLQTMVHLTTRDGQAVANGDGPPIGGSYPTSLWRPGDVVLSHHVLEIPEGARPGPLELRVGWYDLSTGRRLPASAVAQSTLRENGTAAVAATPSLRPW